MMSKSDAILWVERLRDGIRRLPEDAKIFSFELTHAKTGEYMLAIQRNAPVKWPQVIRGELYGNWTECRIQLTPYAFAWWADHGEEDKDG